MEQLIDSVNNGSGPKWESTKLRLGTQFSTVTEQRSVSVERGVDRDPFVAPWFFFVPLQNKLMVERSSFKLYCSQKTCMQQKIRFSRALPYHTSSPQFISADMITTWLTSSWPDSLPPHLRWTAQLWWKRKQQQVAKPVQEVAEPLHQSKIPSITNHKCSKILSHAPPIMRLF